MSRLSPLQRGDNLCGGALRMERGGSPPEVTTRGLLLANSLSIESDYSRFPSLLILPATPLSGIGTQHDLRLASLWCVSASFLILGDWLVAVRASTRRYASR